MKYPKIIAALAAVLITAGCADLNADLTVDGNRTTARALGPVSDPFRQALTNGYKTLGDTEYAEAHMSAANVYYRKAADAAAGRRDLPRLVAAVLGRGAAAARGGGRRPDVGSRAWLESAA